jgi:signal transduction histidine kinase
LFSLLGIESVLYFAAGIVVGVVAAFAVAALTLRRKRPASSAPPQTSNSPTKNAQRTCKAGGAKAEEIGKLMGELAHEIKNPLSTIKINLSLVKEELEATDSAGAAAGLSDDDKQRLRRGHRKLAVIEKETSRLEQILDGFLRYADQTELQPVQSDINELVGDMVDFYSPQAYSHSITIRQGLHSEPLLCRVDPGMLKQAILNLFINAQQAMNEHGEIIARTSRQNDEAVIHISDTGNGIPPERLPDIFKAYYSSRPNGSGLGLPTTKKMVDAHGGTITVDSEPGKGTCFTIRLPLLVEENSRNEASV